MFGRRPNSVKARISVLGFSANRVWLVNRFLYFVRFREGKMSGGPMSWGNVLNSAHMAYRFVVLICID